MAGLKAHIRIHEREENLMCTECGDEFTVQVRMEVAEQRSEVTGGRSLSGGRWGGVGEQRSLGVVPSLGRCNIANHVDFHKCGYLLSFS